MDPIDERLTRAGTAWREKQPPMVLPAIVPVADVPPVRWWRSLVPVVGILVVVLTAAGVLWAVSPRSVVEVAASPGPRPITLLTAGEPTLGCALSWNGGALVRDDRSGLGVRSGDDVVTPVRWPAGYSAYERAGRAVLVDAEGAPVAVDGDIVGYGDAGSSRGIMTACQPSLSANRVVIRNREVPNFSRPLTTDELVAFAAHPAAIGTTVVVETTLIDTTVSDPSTGRWWTAVIESGGTRVHLMADPSVPALLPQDRSVLSGTFALTFQPEAVVLAGPVVLPTTGMPWDAASMTTAAAGAIPAGSLVPVDGWLRVVPRRCLAAPRGSGARQPMDDCAEVWVDDRHWVQGSDAAPTGVEVRPDAWATFGVIPGVDVTLPRYGTWLLRREAGSAGAGSTAGWSVVAALPELPSVALPIPVPTLASPAPGTGGCRGIGLDATLTGDPHDPRVTWLIDRTTEQRIDIVWPAGYRARFAPLLEVLDAGGSVVLRQGDPVTGGCTTGPDAAGPLLIAPGT